MLFPTIKILWYGQVEKHFFNLSMTTREFMCGHQSPLGLLCTTKFIIVILLGGSFKTLLIRRKRSSSCWQLLFNNQICDNGWKWWDYEIVVFRKTCEWKWIQVFHVKMLSHFYHAFLSHGRKFWRLKNKIIKMFRLSL